MSINLNIYKRCPIYVIWELIILIIECRQTNMRYFLSQILSRIAHACTNATEDEHRIKLIDIQGIDIPDDDVVGDAELTTEECKEFFDNLMKTSLPNFMSCEYVGLNFGVYGQSDVYIIYNILPKVIDKYPILDNNQDDIIETKKMQNLYRLYFKFSNSTKMFYKLNDINASEEDIKQFERLRITNSGAGSNIGQTYFFFDVITSYYDFSMVNWDKINEDEGDDTPFTGDDIPSKTAQGVYMNAKTNKLSGNSMVNTIIDSIIHRMSDTSFIEKHIDTKTPMGFYLSNFSKGIEQIHASLMELYREPLNKYKLMFFINFKSFSLVFINQVLFQKKRYPLAFRKNVVKENLILYNNNYKLDFPLSYDNLSDIFSDNKYGFPNTAELSNSQQKTQQDRIESPIWRKRSFPYKSVIPPENFTFDRNTRFLDGSDSWWSYFDPFSGGYNIQEFKKNPERLFREAPQGLPKNLREAYFEAVFGSSAPPFRTTSEGGVGTVYAFFRHIMTDVGDLVRTGIFYEPLKAAISGGKAGGVTQGIGGKYKIEGGNPFSRFFKSIGYQLRDTFVPYNFKEQKFGLPENVEKRLGGSRVMIAIMGALIGIGIRGITKTKWDDFCETSNDVFFAQLQAKSLAVGLSGLVYGEEGGKSCAPVDSDVIETKLKLEKSKVHEDNNDKFNCVDTKVCLEGGAFVGSCSCELFIKLQTAKDNQIKKTMFDNIVLKSRSDLIKYKNSQFEIVLFLSVGLIAILLLVKFLASARR